MRVTSISIMSVIPNQNLGFRSQISIVTPTFQLKKLILSLEKTAILVQKEVQKVQPTKISKVPWDQMNFKVSLLFLTDSLEMGTFQLMNTLWL